MCIFTYILTISQYDINFLKLLLALFLRLKKRFIFGDPMDL